MEKLLLCRFCNSLGTSATHQVQFRVLLWRQRESRFELSYRGKARRLRYQKIPLQNWVHVNCEKLHAPPYWWRACRRASLDFFDDQRHKFRLRKRYRYLVSVEMGVKFDPQTGSTLHIELVRSNSRRKERPGSGPYVVIQNRNKKPTKSQHDQSDEGDSDPNEAQELGNNDYQKENDNAKSEEADSDPNSKAPSVSLGKALEGDFDDKKTDSRRNKCVDFDLSKLST